MSKKVSDPGASAGTNGKNHNDLGATEPVEVRIKLLVTQSEIAVEMIGFLGGIHPLHPQKPPENTRD